MTQQLPELCSTSNSSSAQNPPATLTRQFLELARRFSPQDWLVFAYLSYLNLAILPHFGSPAYGGPALRMLGLLAVYAVLVIPVRARWLNDGFWGPLGYRIAMQGTVQASYFFFLDYLPLVNPGNLDQTLYALDLRLFGFEPCVVFDRFITPLTAEWFAFFYFCYFFVLAIHTIPILLFCRNERLLSEFALGMLLVFCVGHFLYTLVPGFGPYRAIAHLFEHPLPSGYWVDTVLETVKNGGAQKDIFPSIHTAAPTFITLFSFRHRKHAPFRYSWPVLAFFTVNIIIATMFMRWHWLIDVASGLLLASLAFGLSIVVTRKDGARRRAEQLGPSWPLFERLPGQSRQRA